MKRLKVKVSVSEKSEICLLGGAKPSTLNPKELLLYACASCAGMTLNTILAKEKVCPQSVEITVCGTLDTETVTGPSMFTAFRVGYNIACNSIDEQRKVSHAVTLTNDKYCGMIQTLKKVAPVGFEVAIVSTEEITV